MAIDLRGGSCDIQIVRLVVEVERSGRVEAIVDPDCIDKIVEQAKNLGIVVEAADKSSGKVVVRKLEEGRRKVSRPRDKVC